MMTIYARSAERSQRSFFGFEPMANPLIWLAKNADDDQCADVLLQSAFAAVIWLSALALWAFGITAPAGCLGIVGLFFALPAAAEIVTVARAKR